MDERILGKLGLLWATIHVRNLVPDPSGRQVEKPLLDLQFRYRYLTEAALDAIEGNAIPARSETAIKLSYPDVLLPCLPNHVDKNVFFDHLIEVLYAYWGVLKGFAFLHDGGLITQAEHSRLNKHNFATFIERTHGVPRDQVLSEADRGLDVQMMEAKWFADATIARMRAFWDKLIPWIGNDYFAANVKADKWGNRTKGKVGELTRNALEKLPEGPQKTLLAALVDMACEMDELKEYRDADLHFYSPRIVEALGRPDRDSDMFGLFLWMGFELIRCTEALVTCFAVILAGAGKMPEGVDLTKKPWHPGDREGQPVDDTTRSEAS